MPRKRGVKSNEAIPVCYYLPRHPNDWAEDCEENSAYREGGVANNSSQYSDMRLQGHEMGSNSSLAIELGDFGEAGGHAAITGNHFSSSSSLGHLGMPLSRG